MINGLSDKYEHIIGIILHRSSFPSFLRACSMLLLEEQRLAVIMAAKQMVVETLDLSRPQVLAMSNRRGILPTHGVCTVGRHQTRGQFFVLRCRIPPTHHSSNNVVNRAPLMEFSIMPLNRPSMHQHPLYRPLGSGSYPVQTINPPPCPKCSTPPLSMIQVMYVGIWIQGRHLI